MLLIFPPLWNTKFPHLAIPLLTGQLKMNGYNAEVLDLNTLFKKYILSDDFKNFLINRIKNTEKNLSDDELKNRDIYYLIDTAFSPYNFELPYSMQNYKDIKSFVYDSKKNVFLHFFNSVLDKIITEDINSVAIAIVSDTTLISGLTLANLVKKLNIPVCIGGNYISRIKDSLLSLPEFFDIFADIVIYGEGERAIVEFANYINSDFPIEQISNIIYKKENKIILNEYKLPPKLSELAFPDYSDYNFNDYEGDKKTLALSVNRGCYWKKCSFCDMAYGASYSIKPIDKTVAEIQNYIDKYNIRDFFFIDEAISPSYLEKFSDAIIENKLEITFSLYSRFEKQLLKPKIFEKAYKAGLRIVLWGLESANTRVQKLINKGIDLNIVSPILENSHLCGINNLVFCFMGFPTETYEEAMDTVKFISKNIRNIQTIIFGEFGLGKHCKIAENPQKYNVTITENQMDFSQALGYTAPELTQYEKKKIHSIINYIKQKFNK